MTTGRRFRPASWSVSLFLAALEGREQIPREFPPLLDAESRRDGPVVG